MSRRNPMLGQSRQGQRVCSTMLFPDLSRRHEAAAEVQELRAIAASRLEADRLRARRALAMQSLADLAGILSQGQHDDAEQRIADAVEKIEQIDQKIADTGQ